MAKGKFCYVQILNRENQLFVACEVNPKFIERTVDRARDSSRYFVLTLVTPSGSNAYIGMGFTERNDAFDFWAALLDFSARVESEEKPIIDQPGPDLSHLQLREGQTFSLSNPAKSTPSVAYRAEGVAPKPFKLKPPPK